MACQEGFDGCVHPRRITAKKRSKTNAGGAKQASPVMNRFPVVLSTALKSVVNMTVPRSRQGRRCCAYSRLSACCEGTI
jgi:hypothetical protein